MTDDPSLESPDLCEWYHIKGENLDGSSVIASLIPASDGQVCRWIVSFGTGNCIQKSVSGQSDTIAGAKNASNHVFLAMFPENDIKPEKLRGIRNLGILVSSEPRGTA